MWCWPSETRQGPGRHTEDAAVTPSAIITLQELDLSSLDSVRTAAAALRSRHERHRPADQQRRGDVHAEVDDQGRVRAAVRHQPPRPLRAHRAAARPTAAGPGLARRDRQQRRPPHPRRDPFRRPAVGAQLQQGRRVRTGQAGQPVVHLRAAAPTRAARHDHRRRRAPRRVEHRADAQHARCPTRTVRHWSRPCSPQRRTRARCRHCGPPPTPACSAASTTARTVSRNSTATRRWWRPATSPTTSICSADCGTYRRN